MKKRFLIVAILLCVATLCIAQNFPAPRGYVNDFANVLSPEYKAMERFFDRIQHLLPKD